MQNSAQATTKVLITQIGSLLGFSLAKLMLSKDKKVYGLGKKAPPEEILKNPNFTLLDINLAQPFPSHIPQFDLIFHLLPESGQTLKKYPHSKLTHATNNIILLAKQGLSKVILLAPITTSNYFYDRITDDKSRANIKLFLFGDIYGPNEPIIHVKVQDSNNNYSDHFYSHNELTNLISQAQVADKVVLEDEGMRTVFPTYIDDAILAVEKYLDDLDSKSVRVVVSEDHKTTLRCAYSIQKVARIILNRELKMYFSGPEKQIEPQPHPVIRLEYLGFEPKVQLEEGLKKTFDYYKNSKEINKSEFQNDPTEKYSTEPHHRINNLLTSKATQTKRINSRIPALVFGHSIKRILLIIVALIILSFAKTGLDIYLGLSSLQSARNALSSADFESAISNSQSAEKSFKAAANKFQILSLPISSVLSSKTESMNMALYSAELGSSSLSNFTEGIQILATNLEIITSKDSSKKAVDTKGASANFKKAYTDSTKAFYLAQIAQQGKIFTNRLQAAQTTFQDLSGFSSTALELVNFLNDITGTTDEKKYLILLQNNTELRPGGGFIGSFGEIVFKDGRLKEISVEDIYTIDGQLKEEIDPPIQLTEKLGVEQLFLRDSNWSLDFAVNSATARDFYKKETGREVDGVIALDLSFIQDLIEKIGPVKLADYNEEISAQNLFERGEYYSNVGFFPGSSQKRDFLSTLTRTLINKIITSLSSASQNNQNVPWLELINTTRQALSQKHLLVSFDNDNLSTLIKTKGWNNAMPPIYFDPADDSLETRDFLALSEANLGANKVNRYIERKIDYQMTIGRDADLVAKLKIVYKNTAQADTWPAGTYVNFLRVYTPFATSLFDFQNGEGNNLEDVEVTNIGSLTVFSTFVEVPVLQTREVIFTYRIPKNIRLEKAPTYNLYVQKQPGTGQDPFSFTFNLPNYIKIEAVNNDEQYLGDQNITIETDLGTNRQFDIEVVKR